MRSKERLFDELLVLRSQAGDRDALALLVERWQPRLLRQAERLTGDPAAAADLAQEAWMGIVRGLSRLGDPARFPGWAYRIVGNKSRDWIRRQSRRRSASAALSLEPAAESSEEREQAEGELARLRRALTELPEERRIVLSMLYFEGLGVREIAEALHIPVGTVKSRLFKARELLRSRLEESA